MAKRSKVKAKIIDGNNVKEEGKVNVEDYKETVARGASKEKRTKIVWLISRLDYPVVIPYGEKDSIRLSPRQTVKVADSSKLQDKLPNGIVIKK